MTMDFDIEMDVDVDVDNGVCSHQTEEAYAHDIITGDEQEPGEVDEPLDAVPRGADTDNLIVTNKIHIRGLETFTPDDIKAYVGEHHGSGTLDRVEWINDSSANLVFRSGSSAQEALVALAVVEIADATQLPSLETVRAKDYSKKPESVLQIRFAVEGDKKARGAAARSRFYLLHPEFDPDERRRREGKRGKYRERDRDYERRAGRRGNRREDEDVSEPFDVNLYDDGPESSAKRVMRPRRARSRRGSHLTISPESERVRPRLRRNHEKELFPDRYSEGEFARNRSASPVRDRDGDAQMALIEDARSKEAAAARTREQGRAVRERLNRELAQEQEAGRKDQMMDGNELFPTRISLSGSGKAQMDQPDKTAVRPRAKLSDRITLPPSAPGTGLTIRGSAKRSSERGFTIKGTATNVKELFPDKFGNNSGKELIAERGEDRGRGRRRQRAEDLFY